MWLIPFFLSMCGTGVLVPWVIYKAIKEDGKLIKDKFICKMPIIIRVIFLGGIFLFSFLALMMFLFEKEDPIIALYVAEFIFIIIFSIFSYVGFRYKFVVDIKNRTVTAWGIFSK
ncbi:MAG: hypothetical protein J6Z36_00190, partial [Clostridia bacterium]|nr:hypothetical protein [Clostridia bacterium]